MGGGDQISYGLGIMISYISMRSLGFQNNDAFVLEQRRSPWFWTNVHFGCDDVSSTDKGVRAHAMR